MVWEDSLLENDIARLDNDKMLIGHPNSQGALYVCKAAKQLIRFPQQKTFQIVVIHIDTYLNKGQKLRNCCGRFEADCRLSFIHHYCIEVKATRSLAVLVWADSEMGVCQLFFLLPGMKVHVREYAFVRLKLYNSHKHPMGRKASILPEESRRHGAEYRGTRDSQVCLIYPVSPSPHLTGLMVTSQVYSSHLSGDCLL